MKEREARDERRVRAFVRACVRACVRGWGVCECVGTREGEDGASGAPLTSAAPRKECYRRAAGLPRYLPRY